MKKPVSIKLGPDDAALVLRGDDEDGFTVDPVLSPELDAIFEGEEGAEEVALPLNAALVVTLARRIRDDDTFTVDVIDWSSADAVSGRQIVTLEPGQVAIVLGMEGNQISRQLITTPVIDELFGSDDDIQGDDDEEEEEEEEGNEDEGIEIPANVEFALALMTRLDEDDDFRREVIEWYDRKYRSSDVEAQEQ